MAKPLVLAILDGWGYSHTAHGNAIASAETPNISFIEKNYPSLLLQASGKAVGMTWGEPGNSEVGHLTMGAGRILFQAMSRINKSIEDGSFFTLPALTGAVEHAAKNNSRLHLVGLLSSASIHSYFNHIVALLELASRNALSNVYLHLFMDGKDSSPKAGQALLTQLDGYLKNMNIGTIATVIGREYGMDRNQNWDRTEKTYRLLVEGAGEHALDPIARVGAYYTEGYVDADIPPTLCASDGLIANNDSVIFFNFREDSMRQLVRPFIDSQFDIFPVVAFPDVYYCSMTPYFHVSSLHAVFPGEQVPHTLSEILSQHGKTHLHIAETEKYAHTTFFFNGLNDQTFPGETDILIESVKRPVEHPRMKADEITDKVIEEIARDFYDVIIINYANADTLAHAGSLEATIQGVQAIDDNIGRLYKAVTARDGILIITADHGHAESMVYRASGEIKTGHALNPVPLYLVRKSLERERVDYEIAYSFAQVRGIISDVAPTILALLKISQPSAMTGQNLLPLLNAVP